MKNKRIDHISNIMSKHHGIFTEKKFFFQMQRKQAEFKFEIF